MRKRLFLVSLFLVAALTLALAFATGGTLAAGDDLKAMEELGKALYFDTSLSANSQQACATCHAPEAGFTGPDSEVNATTVIYQGALPRHFGNRKPPSAAYAGDSPIFDLYFDEEAEEWLFLGGMFWDGRATGWTLGDPLAEQAQGPFLNPLEQALPNAVTLCVKVMLADYAGLYEAAWGEAVTCTDAATISLVYERIARAIAAYERSAEVNPYSSKYDAYLVGEATLTDQEAMGLELFEGAAMCAACHPSALGPNGEHPLFTDFSYDNLGIPKNLDNPFYKMPKVWNPDGKDWVDPGLGGFLASAGYDQQDVDDNMGKHKVPTLRNVDLRPYEDFVKAYGHNGYFKSLDDIVHFYNTRNVEEWPAPEVADNVNSDELGNLGLTTDEEAAIVAFLKTLSDGFYVP